MGDGPLKTITFVLTNGLPALKLRISSLLTLLLCLGIKGLGATGDSTQFLLPTDSINLTADRLSAQLIFHHRLEPGQSLYGVTKFYGLSLDDIYYLNPRLKGGYEAGDMVRIIMPSVAIRPYIPYDSIDFFSPIYWKLEKGQTIYGLAHRLLKMESDEDIYLNNPSLNAASLQPNQVLFIGWLPISGISTEMQGEVEDPYVKLNTGMRNEWERVSGGKRLSTSTGKAAWTREGDQGKFLAMHRTAPINSLIEVMDKRTGKILYCRVVARIPNQLYDQNVKVVLSPLLVKAFGVRDRFFYVQVKHY